MIKYRVTRNVTVYESEKTNNLGFRFSAELFIVKYYLSPVNINVSVREAKGTSNF